MIKAVFRLLNYNANHSNIALVIWSQLVVSVHFNKIIVAYINVLCSIGKDEEDIMCFETVSCNILLLTILFTKHKPNSSF